jgi:hypothetical protein
MGKSLIPNLSCFLRDCKSAGRVTAVLQLLQDRAATAKWLFPQEKATLLSSGYAAHELENRSKSWPRRPHFLATREEGNGYRFLQRAYSRARPRGYDEAWLKTS